MTIYKIHQHGYQEPQLEQTDLPGPDKFVLTEFDNI